MTDEEYFDKHYDLKWTCPGCGIVNYSNKGWKERQCSCKNESPYMNKEHTSKGLKELKRIEREKRK
jgi:hypothetical protein